MVYTSHGGKSTRDRMLDRIIALLPALAVAMFTFGPRCMAVVLISVSACVLLELVYQKIARRKQTVEDLSAVVTGMLLAYTLPPSAPWWLPLAGAFFAIVVVKMLLGGIAGQNILNSALAGHAFLMVAFPKQMAAWVLPGAALPLFGGGNADAIAGATPLAALKNGALPTGTSLLDLLVGQTSGCIGEVSKLALLAGGLYLIYRRVITARIPAAYLLTVAVLTVLFPQGDMARLQWMLAELLSGGMVLGAFFMATDDITSPGTTKGQAVFGIGCGLLTVLLREFSSMPEGVTYAVLLMNVCVWWVGHVKKSRGSGDPRDGDGKLQQVLENQAKEQSRE